MSGVAETLKKEYVVIPIAAVVSIIGVIIVRCVCCVHRRRRPDRAPPGPNVSPYVGNYAVVFGKNRVKVFSQLRRTYGDVFSVYFGKQLVVVLNGYDTINVALAKNAEKFHTRPVFAYQLLTQGDNGLIFGEVRQWPKRRQFLMEGFHKFALDSKAMPIEERIHIELEDLVIEFSAAGGKAVDLNDYYMHFLGNFLSGIIYGKRFIKGDEQLEVVISHTREMSDIFWHGVERLLAFPWMLDLPGQKLKVNQYIAWAEEKKQLFKTLYEKHILLHNEQELNSMFDYFVSKSWESPDAYSLDELFAMQLELTSAIIDPCHETLNWIILELLHNPDLQSKLHMDIDRVIGNRPVKLEDRDKLTLVRATILETLRLRNPMPFAIPYAVQEDVDFLGFKIPANTVIIPNLMSIFMDSNLFRLPQKFLPDRFLNGEGKIEVPPEFIPFSVGHRACIGQSMGRMVLFLTVTTLLQNFRFEPEEGQRPPSLDAPIGPIYRCPDFKARLIPRKKTQQPSGHGGYVNTVVNIE